MKTFTKSIFSFLFVVTLFFVVNQEVRGQWELLLGEVDTDWGYVDMDVTLDDGLIVVISVDGEYRLLKINVLGQVVMNRSFAELGLPIEGIRVQEIKALKDGNYWLRYEVKNPVEYKLSKLTPYGKIIWETELYTPYTLIEMESGNYWEVITVGGAKVVLSAISSKDGSELWRKDYDKEICIDILQQKPTKDGGYMVAGMNYIDDDEAFAMYFSAEGDFIDSVYYKFEGMDIYDFHDMIINQDEGLSFIFRYTDYGETIYEDKDYLVFQKWDKMGNLEIEKEYNYTSPYPLYCGYYFYKIEQTSNENYFIRGDYSCEGDARPHYIWLSPIGNLTQQHTHGFDGDYPSEVEDCWNCGCESAVSEIYSISDNGYVLSGYDLYYQPNGFDCMEIPFVVHINTSGGIRYYDLGDSENLSFYYIESLLNSQQGVYLVAEVVDWDIGDRKVYIINTNNGGKSYNNLINGHLYLDSNENCEPETTETGWAGNTVISIVTPEITRYAFTNQYGQFSAELLNGDYTISYLLEDELVEMGCGTSEYTANFSENYDTLSNLNFPLKALVDCPKLEVEIGTPLLRRCFKNTYKVSYCNKGTLAAEDAKISLEFPEEMIPLTSSINPTLQEGQQWTFDLGTIGIGECGFFTVVDSISCEADLGSTICLKSRILPDDPCEAPNPLWDGSDIEVEGECLEEHIAFSLENVGSGNMDEERNLYVYENDVLVKTEKFQLASGEKKQFFWNMDGKTVRLEAEQSPHFPHFNDQAQSIVEACGEGNFSYGYVNSVEQNDRPPSVDIDCQTIIGSFDPNDIQVFPKGISEQHYIEENTKLTYKIRFQNTGNDTAFRVMIVDTLPQGLEGATLNLGNSSHDYTFDIKFGNLLVWTFDNILLPDSTTNEPESHGFVQYSIQLKEGLELGTKIENKADIYFDFNEPVATNRVFNTLTDDLNTGLGEPLAVDLMDLEAKAMEGNHVQLYWWTLSELNSSHFEVERSSDGVDFEVIAEVKARGNSEGLQHYQLMDSNIEGENVLYYRLKMADIDGSFDYSKVVSVRLSGQKLQYRVLGFNGRQVLLDWMGEEDEVYTIAVYNTFGQIVLKYKAEGLNTVLPKLDIGVYVLQVYDSQHRIIKTKKVFGS